MSKRRKYNTYKHLWYERRQLALDMEDVIHERARRSGLQLRVSIVQGPHREFLHWMFNDARGKRILDFWPTSYTWRNPNTGEKGTVESLSDALEVALDYAERVAVVNAKSH